MRSGGPTDVAEVPLLTNPSLRGQCVTNWSPLVLSQRMNGDHRDGRQLHGRSSLLRWVLSLSIRPDRGADRIGRRVRPAQVT
jgi:hypothetical protein